MLNNVQEHKIKSLIKNNLDRAEKIWGNGGYNLIESLESDELILEKAESVNSFIPGYPTVAEENTPLIDTFIAMVADIRGSSQNLSNRQNLDSGIQRVYYETSALLPAMAMAIQYQKGQVTEYLGDGILALFRIEDNAAIISACNAAISCIDEVRVLVNEELFKRYRLPELNIGIGLSMSKAIISLVGLNNAKQAKIIGECVYKAAKLSKGKNEIITDKKTFESFNASIRNSFTFTKTNTQDYKISPDFFKDLTRYLRLIPNKFSIDV